MNVADSLRRKENLDAAYADNNTLSLLAENGYNINLYTSPYYAYNTAHSLPIAPARYRRKIFVCYNLVLVVGLFFKDARVSA